DLGSALFVAGEKQKAKETWGRIIAGDDSALEDYETYLNALTQHGLAAEARSKLAPALIARLKRISRTESSYSRQPNADFEALKPLLRSPAASFNPPEHQPLSAQAEAAKTAFFRQLCEAAPNDKLLPEMLLSEPIVQPSQRAAFYQILIK